MNNSVNTFFVYLLPRGQTFGRKGIRTGVYSSPQWCVGGEGFKSLPLNFECQSEAIAQESLEAAQPVADAIHGLRDPTPMDVVNLLESLDDWTTTCEKMNAQAERFYAVTLGRDVGIYISQEKASLSLKRAKEDKFRKCFCFTTFQGAYVGFVTHMQTKIDFVGDVTDSLLLLPLPGNWSTPHTPSSSRSPRMPSTPTLSPTRPTRISSTLAPSSRPTRMPSNPASSPPRPTVFSSTLASSSRSTRMPSTPNRSSSQTTRSSPTPPLPRPSTEVRGSSRTSRNIPDPSSGSTRNVQTLQPQTMATPTRRGLGLASTSRSHRVATERLSSPPPAYSPGSNLNHTSIWATLEDRRSSNTSSNPISIGSNLMSSEMTIPLFDLYVAEHTIADDIAIGVRLSFENSATHSFTEFRQNLQAQEVQISIGLARFYYAILAFEAFLRTE